MDELIINDTSTAFNIHFDIKEIYFLTFQVNII